MKTRARRPSTSAKISKGGQISLPAEVRRRWGTARVLVEDQGDALVLRPQPDDPIAALIGSMPLPPGVTSEGLRAEFRAEEEAADIRKWGSA